MKRFMILAMACSICLTASGCFSQGSGASESVAVTTQPATEKANDDTAPSASVKPTESATEKATEKAQEKPTEKPTEKATEKSVEVYDEPDYSSYLGMWSYTYIPDEIPEEIKNNESAYNQFMSERPSIKLNFIKIENDTATFELSNGNVKFVSATVVTAQIVDNQINFEYTDGWNGKGHGTITLNGDTVHVNCVEEEHGNGRNTLNCDETLTRE